MKTAILNLLKRYKYHLLAIALVWGFITFVQVFAISPLKEENKELKEERKARQKQNEALQIKIKIDSVILAEKDKRINEFDSLQTHYKNLVIKNQLDYEKQKTDYISRSLAERRRLFAKLANE